jgi:hypothetical protein
MRIIITRPKMAVKLVIWSSDMSSDRSSDKKVETFYTGFRLAT